MAKLASVLALVLAALVALAWAQSETDLRLLANPSDLDGLGEDFVDLIEEAEEEVSRLVPLTPTNDQVANWTALAEADQRVAQIPAWHNQEKNLTQLKEQRDTIMAEFNIKREKVRQNREKFIKDMNASLHEWREKWENITKERDAAVDSEKSVSERAAAYYNAAVTRLAIRAIAANVVKFRVDGQANVLDANAMNATIFILNNTIARNNDSKVDDRDWTPIDNVTRLQELARDILVNKSIAQYRRERAAEVVATVNEEIRRAHEELKEKINDIKAGVRAKIDELKAAWKATADLNLTLAQRIEDFIENVTGVEVTVTGLETREGNVSIVITLIYEGETVTLTGAQIKAYIREHIKALLIANAGVSDSDVVVEEPVETTVTVRKRAASEYTISASVGGAEAEAGSASFATISFATLALGALAMLF